MAAQALTFNPALLPQWWAHRGGGNRAPENTLQGFAAAYNAGFRAAEFDVKLTRDNRAVVIHDDDLHRVAGVDKNVRDLTFAELNRIDAGLLYPAYRPAYVPALEDVALFCRERGIAANVEIKPCPGRDEETAEIVVGQSLQLWQQSVPGPLFSSFSTIALAKAQQLFPAAPRGLLLEEWPATDDEVLTLLRRLECVSAHLPDTDLTRERVQLIRNAGFVVLVWTVNDWARARELLSWGVTGIITDLITRVPPAAGSSDLP